MDDIAQLGIAVDTGPVVAATQALDRLAAQSASTAAAVNTLANSTKTAATTSQAAVAATTAQTVGLQRQAAAATQAGAAQVQAANVAAQAARTAAAGHQAFGAALAGTAANANRATAAIGLAGYQMTNLGYQINDIATGLLTGQSPFMIMAQQGGQVLQILQSGQGGVLGALKGIGSSLAGMVTVGRVAAGALAAVAIGGVTAYVSWENQIRSLSRSLQGLGRQSGLTVADLQRIGTRGAANSGLSTSEGLGLAGQLAGSGKIGGSVMQGIIEQTKTFARITGQALPDAGEQLAKAFSDPAKGAKTLDDALGFLDDRTLKLIEHMARSGDTVGAQQVLLQKFSQDLKPIVDDTWSWSKAWDAVANSASNATQAVGQAVARAVNGPSIDEQAEILRRGAAREAAIAASRAARGLQAENVPNNRFTSGAALDDIREQQRMRNGAASRATAQAAARQASKAAGAIIDQNLPEIQSIKAIEEEFSTLDNLLKQSGGLEKLSATAKEAGDALAALGRQRDTYLTQAQAQAQADTLSIKAIEARTVAEKAAIAVEQTRLSLAGKRGVTPAQEAAQEAAAQARIIAESTMQSRDQLRQLQDSSATAGMLPYAKALEDINLKYARQIELANGDAEAISNLTHMRQLEIGAMQKEQIVKPIQDSNRNNTEQIAALHLQQDTFGATTRVVAEAAAKQQLLNSYNAAGVPITNALSQAIAAQASQAGKAAQAAADLGYQQGLVIESMDAVRSGAGGFLSSFTEGILNGKKGVDALRDSLRSLLGDITKRLEGSVIDQLFGKMGTAGGDHPGVFGGALQSLFGGFGSKVSIPGAVASAVATANITAGIVNVMGGAGAGLGGSTGGTLLSGIGRLLGVNPAGSGSNSAYANGGGPGTSFVGAVSGLSRNVGSMSLPTGGIADYVKLSAAAHGIDPSVALRVAKSEGGLSSWNLQSGVMKNGMREPSFGPFQLLRGGGQTGFPAGLGNRFMSQTGLDPSRASSGPAGIDFAMQEASQKGWGQWYGAKGAGIGNMQGIGAVPTDQMQAAQDALKKLGGAAGDATTSVSGLAQPLTDAAKNLGNLGQGAAQTAPALADAAGGVNQLSSSLSSGGGGSGTGLLGVFGRLFGGSSGSGAGADWNFDVGGQGLASGFGFSGGGYTGHGHVYQPAGVVHRGEVVWSQHDISNAGGVGVVEAMRRGVPGYASGGVAGRVSSPRAPSAAGRGGSGGGTNITIVNQAISDGYTTKQRKSSSGSMDDVVIEIVKKAHMTGQMDKPMAARHGISPVTTRR